MAVNDKAEQILIVEDDLHSLRFMESSLRLAGFTVFSARSFAEARRLLGEVHPNSLSAVLTDYRLPKETGLDLIRYLREKDDSLAAVVITGQGEKTVVQGSLEVGAFQYLEKPVTHQTLKTVMMDAVKKTRRMRQSFNDRKGLEALEQLDHQLNVQVPESLKERLHVHYRPLHEVGGDFFIAHESRQNGLVLLVGDVSGHDIKSGFVSTYFQGMFRGSVESGSSVPDFIQLFNRTLRVDHQNGASDGMISLSLAAFQIPPGEKKLLHWNFGMPPSIAICKQGRLNFLRSGNFPLGWVSEIELKPEELAFESIESLFIFTDGLIELATDLDVNLVSLLFRLIQAEKTGTNLPFKANDDILVIQFITSKDTPLNATYEPIISEHYAGTEVDHIDQLQSNWRRNLVFALDDKMGDRLYDLLICIREGMINALTHGCERSPEKFAHLQISIDPGKSHVRVVIDDPGRGHQFDIKKTVDAIQRQESKHLGLGIIQHLSNDYSVLNNGTSLVFDFEVTPEPPKQND